jgi:hypothetical protein
MTKISILLITVFVLVPLCAFAGNIDPVNKFAYGENIGWVNLEPLQGTGVTVADTTVTGYAWGENIGWINLDPANSGVVNDGKGNLSGYAWGENVGWINFEEVKIDPATGIFSGYAWGENIGWINFAPSGAPVKTLWVATYTLNLAKSGNGSVKVSGGTHTLPWSGQFASGTQVQLEAVADSGWSFSNWSGDLTGSANPTTITVTGNKNITVNFNQNCNLLLTININPQGSGTVTNNPDKASYCNNDQVSLTANPGAGYNFSSWSGVDSSSGATAQVTMNAARTVTATFTATNTTQYTLTATKSGNGNGSISAPGLSCSGSACTGTYNAGVQAVITATPDANSTFAGWSECDSANGNQCTVTMNTNKNLTATFTLINTDSYTLNVIKSGTGNGVVTSSPKGIDCGSDCNETYTKNTKPKRVTLKVKPDANSTFLGWGGDCQGSGIKKSCSLKMDSDKNVSASFGLPDIAVSPNSYDFGDVTVKQSSAAATFTIQNNGTGNLKITKIKIIGTDARMFKIKGSCKKTISAGGNCQSTITFKPVSAGSKTATLLITSNDPDTPTLDILIGGNGI